ncbi:MAG: zf-HC2 domain-containing protein, partial [candidate division Zixibacteria bacterium]|nr:zf-HC2 domain-containing protein [candidate division Zixibacteria bacterium]
MPVTHLTDEEIQEYLDGNLSHQKRIFLEAHLKTCELCQAALKQYQSLYVGLKQDQVFDLPKSFAKSIVAKLPMAEKAKSGFNYSDILLGILATIITALTASYYLDLGSLGRRLTHILLPHYEIGLRLLDAAKSLVTALQGNLSLLVVGILVLLVTGALDRILFQPLIGQRRHV